ncbi:hypothetical protein [Variibacter gotjawalensis]|uniref:hypothetical protein n=1 Tax=Variibacter gotjawalensis TaxID=1333996 RepID=UPI00102C3ED6|nr:hypothetical protein [Variibacter gotjawalensis]NIK46314.1 hypothetical protein [Variibacter gotjawalensis]
MAWAPSGAARLQVLCIGNELSIEVLLFTAPKASQSLRFKYDKGAFENDQGSVGRTGNTIVASKWTGGGRAETIARLIAARKFTLEIGDAAYDFDLSSGGKTISQIRCPLA